MVNAENLVKAKKEKGMKKRVLALMLVLGMTFSLAACGSSNDKKSDDTKTETTDKDSKEKMTTVK